MATVRATEFKARCLELMDRVADRGETYVITKRGKPVAKLVPADPSRKTSIFGCMSDWTQGIGDFDTPLWTDHEWRGFERRRDEQARAWESEWRRRGTISATAIVEHMTLVTADARIQDSGVVRTVW